MTILQPTLRSLGPRRWTIVRCAYVPSCLFVRTFVCLLSASNEPMLYLDCCLCWLGSLVVLQYLYFYMWNHLQNKDKKITNSCARPSYFLSFFRFGFVGGKLWKDWYNVVEGTVQETERKKARHCSKLCQLVYLVLQVSNCCMKYALYPN